jgi:hypothetical protein
METGRSQPELKRRASGLGHRTKPSNAGDACCVAGLPQWTDSKLRRERSGKRPISSYEGAKVNRLISGLRVDSLACILDDLVMVNWKRNSEIVWKAKAVDEVVQGQTKGKSSFSLSSE